MSATGPASRMSEEEIADMQEVFDNFDVDKNGTIDLNELATVLRSLGYNPSSDQLENMMKQADENGDGVLSFDEFLNMVGTGDVKTNFEMEIEQIQKAFDRMDTDGNGHVDRSELAAIMRAFGQKLSDEQVDMMVQQADKNNDGQISCEEFVKFIYDDGVDDSESVY